MKITSLIIGFLISMSVAHANTAPAALNLEGRVVKATGLEAGREGQSCSLTLQETGHKEAKFYFGIGDRSDLFGVREANTKRVFSDYVYLSPEVSIGEHAIRQEQITIDVKSNGTAVLIRRLFEKGSPDSHVIFKYDQLDQKSEIRCELRSKSLDSDEELSADGSVGDSNEETSL